MDWGLVTIITDPLRDYDRGESESECEEEDDQSGHIDDCFCEEPGVVPVRASSGKMEVHCA